jgi:SEC-C motif-containing protein
VVAKEKVTDCPCGSAKDYAACCGQFINDSYTAPTAEVLMRSRYAAYTLRNEAYLLATWYPSTRPASLNLDEPPSPKWIGLQVLRHELQDDSHAIVEFVARYKINGRAIKLHETSRFLREHGQWFYLDGETS